MLLLSRFWICRSLLCNAAQASAFTEQEVEWSSCPLNWILQPHPCQFPLWITLGPWEGWSLDGWRDTPGPFSDASLLRDGYNFLCPWAECTVSKVSLVTEKQTDRKKLISSKKKKKSLKFSNPLDKKRNLLEKPFTSKTFCSLFCDDCKPHHLADTAVNNDLSFWDV